MTEDEGRLRFRERQAAQREHAALLARTAGLVSSTIVGLKCIECARRKCRVGYDRCALCIYAHAGAGTAGQPRQLAVRGDDLAHVDCGANGRRGVGLR